MVSPSYERGGAQATEDRQLSLGLSFPSAEGNSHQIHLKANSALRIDQHARIQNRMRVEGALGRPERTREALGPLAVVPWAMVTADRMMVRDRAAELE